MIGETVEWMRHARRVVPRQDRRVLLSPPRLVSRFWRFARARHAGRARPAEADDVRRFDPEFAGLILDFFELLGRGYFRLRTSGVELVPESGPVLLVGNHNGGLVPTDGFFTAVAIRRRFGEKRAMFSLAHDFLFDDELLRSYALRLGMLRASSESARHVFAAGGLLLVYPGGDLETFRPFADRGRVDLGGRTGFIELALRERVPIVPVVSAGAHEQLIVLTRGDRLARLVRAHAWARTDVFPLVLALPWGLTSGFMPYLPLPAQTEVTFGAPIRWPALGPGDAERPEVVQRCYDEVESRMQAMLDRLMEGRRFLLGRRP